MLKYKGSFSERGVVFSGSVPGDQRTPGSRKGRSEGRGRNKDEAPQAPVRCIDDKSNRSEVSDSGENLFF